MKPERLIAGFLQVWDNNPEVFETTGAIAGLESLRAAARELREESNRAIADRIEELCEDYPGLAEAIVAANRKPKPKSVKSAPAVNVLDNRYPELSETLRDRVQNYQKNES